MARTDYEERKAARIERYEELAEKHQQAQKDCWERSDQLVEHIPMGQPILVGHHSEKGHRRTLEKSRNLMFKGVEHGKTADYYERRAEAAKSDRTISSDDPEAIAKLKAKIHQARVNQEIMKVVNATIRKHKKAGHDAQAAACVQAGLTEDQAHKILAPDFAGRIGFPGYALSNNLANVKRMEERLKTLEKIFTENAEESAEIRGEDYFIEEDREDNRVRIYFDDKPDEETRAWLKRHGWKWSPRAGAWQRFASTGGMVHAEQFHRWRKERS